MKKKVIHFEFFKRQKKGGEEKQNMQKTGQIAQKKRKVKLNMFAYTK